MPAPDSPPVRPAAEAVAVPGWHPPPAVLDLVELVLDGALSRLPDGLPDPRPDPTGSCPTGSCSAEPSSTAPDKVVGDGRAEHEPNGWPGEGGRVVLEDAEGTPVAAIAAGGRVIALRPFAHPPLRGHRRSPAQVRGALAASTAAATGSGQVIAVPVGASLTAAHVDHLAAMTAGGARLLWLPLVGAGRPGPGARGGGLAPEALWRAVRALAVELGGVVVPLALPAGHDRLLPEIARAYGADRLAGLPAADGDVHPAFARELARAVRPAARRGLVVFLTGLSGSGKSTVARALAERLLDDGRRSLTLLDGDEVRRMLSAGLGFSAADREANIRRIGFVAAEVARHGGTAICAPIAPFAAVRDEVRTLVERAGGDLVLVHVATPLAECERRDRKGLYAKARRGEIGEFTGISSPYESPTDADLVLDTTGVPIEDGVAQIWGVLQARGYLADDAE